MPYDMSRLQDLIERLAAPEYWFRQRKEGGTLRDDTPFEAGVAIVSLTERVAHLEDLLETAYRKRDEARAESEKANDEALQWKTKAAHNWSEEGRQAYATILEWKGRAEAAEAKLKEKPDA